MNITIKDYVGFSFDDNLKLVKSLLDNRKPKESSFDYGLETHGIGCFGETVKIAIPYAIIVHQSNIRKSDKSPIVITIKQFKPL